MDQTDSITIMLAGEAYVIYPFTVGQLEELHVGVMYPSDVDPKENVRNLWRRNVDVLAAALSQDHPQMTRDVIYKKRLGSIKVVNNSINQILKFAGIAGDDPKVPAKEPAPGEAKAAA